MKLNKRIITKLRKEIHKKKTSIHSLKEIKSWYKNIQIKSIYIFVSTEGYPCVPRVFQS